MQYQKRLENFCQQPLEKQRETIGVLVRSFVNVENDLLQDIVSLRSSVNDPSADFCVTVLQLIYALLEQAEHQKELLHTEQQQKLHDKFQEIANQEALDLLSPQNNLYFSV